MLTPLSKAIVKLKSVYKHPTKERKWIPSLLLLILIIMFSAVACGVATDDSHYYAQYDYESLNRFLSNYEMSDIRWYLDKHYRMTEVYDYEEIKDEAIGMGWVDDWYDESH